MRCVVWPASSSRYFLYIPMGVYQQGWHSFLDMLKSFAKKKKLFDNQNPKIQGNIPAQGSTTTPHSHFPKDHIANYADIVKRQAWSSSHVLPLAKQSTSVKGLHRLQNPLFCNLENRSRNLYEFKRIMRKILVIYGLYQDYLWIRRKYLFA